MTEYNEGDLVEAVKGDRVIRDRITKPQKSSIFADGPYLGAPTLFTLSSVRGFAAAGYTLTVLERANPPLPTRNGAYQDDYGRVWLLGPDGWVLVSDEEYSFCPLPEDPADEDNFPFRMLVPEVKS